MSRLPLAAALISTLATAAPALRFQTDVRGDFVLIGNTLGHDCSPQLLLPPYSVPLPRTGTVGACGLFLPDTAMDVFWRADGPAAGQAEADGGVPLAQARSTAVLQLPVGAQVTYARLYWSADDTVADPTATVERPGVFSVALTADVSTTSAAGTLVPAYQASANVTALVQQHGSGAFRVGGVTKSSPLGVDNDVQWAAWHLVVFYSLDSEPSRNLALFDGLDFIEYAALPDGGVAALPVTSTIDGFVVPNAGFDAKLAVIAYEGDVFFGGDSLRFNGNVLSGPSNPADNFFNSTRIGVDGTPATRSGDLPWLFGTPGTMSSVDFDVVPVTSYLQPGATSATVTAASLGDLYFLGGFVTSISTFKPVFTNTTKTVTDLNAGAVRPGDVLEVTITTLNSGNDSAVDTRIVDPLPNEVTFEPGTLRIDASPAGAQVGAKSDSAGNDEAEYDALNHRVTFRVGLGANATVGGRVNVNEAVTVKFRVRIKAGTSGTLSNQATVTASGLTGQGQGVPAQSFPSRPGTGLSGPTLLPIDNCALDADCTSPGLPRCFTPPSPNQCVACLVSADCRDATRPVCDFATNTCQPCASAAQCTDPARPLCSASSPTVGQCVRCSAADSSRCVGATPLCDVARGNCVACLSNAQCSGAAPYCDVAQGLCRPCQGDGAPFCPGNRPACQASGACGQCSATNASQCVGSTPQCKAATATCVQCLNNTQCAGGVCDLVTNSCVGCTTNADCPTNAPVCNPGLSTCGPCSSDSQCTNPLLPACQAGGALVGRCAECSATNASRCGGGRTVCDTAAALCVECTQDSNCSGGKKCDLATRTCVGCLSNLDCPATAPVCGPSRVCGPCLTDAQCTNPLTPACQPNGPLVGQCTECSAARTTRCVAPRPACDALAGRCVVCTEDSQCSAPTPKCSPATKACVACVVNADCPSTAPRCDGATNTCTACTTDGDCAGTPLTPACQKSGGNVGRCAACSDTNKTTCGGATPACDLGRGLCVECVDDSTCTAAKPSCDASTKQCTARCTPTSCKAPTPYCSASTGLCVACVADTDCGGQTPLCGSSGVCVQCKDNSVCPATAPVCTDGACGACTSDSQCVDPARPRCAVSGAAAGTCVDGNAYFAGAGVCSCGASGSAGPVLALLALLAARRRRSAR